MFGLFKKSIKVVFIDAATGEAIGTSDMPKEQLPESFDKPTTIQIYDSEWQVVKAEPVHSKDFASTKKLTIYLRKTEYVNPANVRFSLPTISNDSPGMTATSLYNDFTLALHEDDWRQTEFLPAELIPEIEKEITAIKVILDQGAGEPFKGYDTIHVRKVQPAQLSIPFDNFCRLVNALEKGSTTFALSGEQGFVANGFAVRSTNGIYYGTIREGIIKELCVYQAGELKDEFQQIATANDLVFVNWCSAQMFRF